MNCEKLYFLRHRNGLTQTEMGLIVGVKKYSICNWENGNEIIPLSKLNIYSNYFDVSIDYILGLSLYKGNSNKGELGKFIIGKNIRYIREMNNLTQRDLARILNTSHSNICAYENGRTLILTAFAYQLCCMFNVSMDWLCGKVNEIVNN